MAVSAPDYRAELGDTCWIGHLLPLIPHSNALALLALELVVVHLAVLEQESLTWTLKHLVQRRSFDFDLPGFPVFRRDQGLCVCLIDGLLELEVEGLRDSRPSQL